VLIAPEVFAGRVGGVIARGRTPLRNPCTAQGSRAFTLSLGGRGPGRRDRRVEEMIGRVKAPMTFVLVHGGWQGGWVWEKVVRVLETRGHAAVAPTLRGMEGDAGGERAGLTLTDLATALLSELDDPSSHELVLVGHSGGGPVVQYVADRLADRVRRTVFMSAWVLEHGQSINDIRTTEQAAAARREAARSADGTVPMDPHVWQSTFMQDATPEELAAVLPRIVPTPIGWFEDPLDIPRFFQLRLPASYVFLRDDLSAPRERFQQHADRLHDPRIVECGGSHQAMLTRPEEVATTIIAAAEDR
jgi:pimeloyl-ACP methyl ester carboxylesterase